MQALARRCLGAFGLKPTRWADHLLLTTHRANGFDTDLDLGRIALNVHLTELLRRWEINCVIDVGANTGQYARNLRYLGYAGHIVSFEPVPDAYRSLSEQARRDGRWTVLPFALGDREGPATFNVTRDTQFSSLLAPNAFAQQQFIAQVDKTQVLRLDVRRLDSLFDSILPEGVPPRVFLKMDTQGNDLAVFSGLGDRVSLIVGLQSEVSLVPIYDGMPSAFEAIPVYRQNGFAITGLFPISRDDSGRMLEYDCVMARFPL